MQCLNVNVLILSARPALCMARSRSLLGTARSGQAFYCDGSGASRGAGILNSDGSVAVPYCDRHQQQAHAVPLAALLKLDETLFGV